MNKIIIGIGIVIACGVFLLNSLYPIMVMSGMIVFCIWIMLLAITLASRQKNKGMNRKMMYSFPLSVVVLMCLYKTNGFSFKLPLSFEDGLVLIAFLTVLIAFFDHVRMLSQTKNQLTNERSKLVSSFIGSSFLLIVTLLFPSSSTRQRDELMYKYQIDGKTIEFYDSINGKYYTDGMNQFGETKSRSYMNLSQDEYLYVDFYSRFEFFDDGNKVFPLAEFEDTSIYRLTKGIEYDIYYKEAKEYEGIYQVLCYDASRDSGRSIDAEWEQIEKLISSLVVEDTEKPLLWIRL